ncbi:hypothetical protein L249_3657 [Ophiocordyceps polyrhachis-furcata BCC 54312]|uniref:Histone deacetylase domain-containing protein n=1 Tax=Ophiocordyceps polyrhachis-furcata BCC 54312 TaxID=1330021 RepID=A0A367L4Y4_9HYPO|nr:hypothetical protein L249_3657 [Ophiocordyceps polyrhachis-furcata BCC 54312]
MSSLSPARSATGKEDDEDAGLSQSLQELTLTTTAQPRRSSAFQRRRSSQTSARPGVSSRSPSSASRAVTPPLIRKASLNSLRSANGPRSLSRRSSSAHLSSPTPKAGLATSHEDAHEEDERPFVTANSVASDYFRAELDALDGPGSAPESDVIVVLNDAVYGHRYSRPRTSRGTLSTIVERPERIKATVLGIATAYVKLGRRHGNGMLPHLPWAPFRIRKTERRVPLTSAAVTNVHGVKWMEELKVMCDAAESRLAMGTKELQRPHANRAGSDAATPTKLHEGDLYLCAESLEAMEGALGAVCEAVDTVFSSAHRRAFVGVRPPGHHCSASHPSGFCWVNNVHVGIMHAMLAHGLTHAAIIDFDLHHGDGSQDIAWQHNSRSVTAAKNAAAWKKTSIGYFSMHDINSYPCEMGDEEKVKNASLCIDNAHGQSVWNVHLEPWKSEEDFWLLYETKYASLLEKAGHYLRRQAGRLRASNQTPKAAIFLSAGFDASEWEGLGMQRHRVNVPTSFYAALGRDVVKLAAEEGLAVDGRVISVLEGGYSDRALFSGIFSHLCGLVGDSRPSTTEVDGQEPVQAPTYTYDPSWWSSSELDKLEKPPEPPEPPRKPRVMTPPTYSTPTQASTAKVVDPEKMRRSLSGIGTARPMERPPTPPPPQVPWMVAAHELSKLIIPTGRQTDSCRPEDLNAEATRARRDRQSNLVTSAPVETSSRPTSRMALRERKTKVIVSIDEEAAELPAKSRRKTVGVSGVSAVDKSLASSTPALPQGPPSTRPGGGGGRRLSATPAPFGLAKEEALAAEAGHDDLGRPASAVVGNRPPSRGKLAVKKTRSTGGKDTASRAPPRSPKAPAKEEAQRPPGGPVSSAATGADTTDAMDGITAGMKRIKINLVTRSQREAREATASVKGDDATLSPPPRGDAMLSDGALQHATDADAGAIAARTPAGANDAGVNLAKTASSTGGRPVTPTTVVAPQASSALESPDPLQGPAVVNSSPRTMQPCQVGGGGDVFVRHQPSNPSSMSSSSSPQGEQQQQQQQPPLRWQPSNVPMMPPPPPPQPQPQPQPPSVTTTTKSSSPLTSPSAAGKKNGGLFHYTSSGIPFAPRSQPGDEGSVWEVPESPRA